MLRLYLFLMYKESQLLMKHAQDSPKVYMRLPSSPTLSLDRCVIAEVNHRYQHGTLLSAEL